MANSHNDDDSQLAGMTVVNSVSHQVEFNGLCFGGTPYMGKRSTI